MSVNALYKLLSIMFLAMILSSTIGYTINTKTYYRYMEKQVKLDTKIPFYVSIVLHLHQPIYDVRRNICELVSNPSSTVYDIFKDRSRIYTYRVLDLIDYINKNNLPVNISIDITGTLIEDLENISDCASSIPGLENYTYIVENWSSRNYDKVEFFDTAYHYLLLPMIMRFSNNFGKDLLQYEVSRYREKLYGFTNKYPGISSATGFYPPEIALDMSSLRILADLGYNYTFIDDLHIYRIFKDYLNPARTPETWYTHKSINVKTDPLYLLNADLGTWIYLRFNIGGTYYYHLMNPYIGLRPHVIRFDNEKIVVFPRNRFFSVLMHSIMYMTNDNVSEATSYFLSLIDYLENYNNDPSRPFILVMIFDGDNGDPLTHEDTWWLFLKKLIENVTTPGSPYNYVKFVSPGWYLTHVYNPVNDYSWSYASVPFIEPGSWNTDDGWGDPYFTKWIYPSKYSNEEKMLSNITKGVAHYLNAKANSPSDPLLNTTLWYLGLALQSDWFYYPSSYALGNSSIAVDEAINTAEQLETNDLSGPAIMYAWFENPDNNYWPGIVYSNTHPWIKIHVWDTSSIQRVDVDIYSNSTLLYTYTAAQDPDLPGNYYIHIDRDLPIDSMITIGVHAVDSSGNDNYYEYRLFKVVDPRYRLDGVLDTDARPLWINTTNHDLQYLFVNDTLDPIYIGFNTTRAGSGYDTFLFVSTDPSRGYVSHPWAKNGYVPYYDAYIGMEESNGWYGLWFKVNGCDGEKYMLITHSWKLDYYWDSTSGFAEVLLSKTLFNASKLFLGVAAWETSDYGNIYEKLRMVSTHNTLYRDELIGIYLGSPMLKNYFTPSKGLNALNEILKAINNAKAYIYITMYHWENYSVDSPVWRIAEAVVNAKNRGVWIAVVVDDNYADTNIIKYLESNGIRVVNDADTRLMHSKYIIVDGVTLFFGSANLVDTAFYVASDGSYQYNNLVEVKSTWFAKPFEYEFIEMYYKRVFHGGETLPNRLSSENILLNNTWVEVEFHFLPEDGSVVENELVNMITYSSPTYLMIYVLTLDSIGDSLVSSYKHGYDVKVLISYNERSVTGTEYYKLLDNHVPVALNYDELVKSGSQLLHIKTFIFNDSVVATGSMNPTYSGLYRNDEDFVVIHWSILASIYEEFFNNLWDNFTAHIYVKVFEGDKPAVNAFVNITAIDLSSVTDNHYEWYNYTCYTNADGEAYIDAYLWYPNPYARFIVSVSTSEGSNSTMLVMGLDNNTARIILWITLRVKPLLIISGPKQALVSEIVNYTIMLEYPNNTIVPINASINIYVNNTLYGQTTLMNGVGSWSYNASTPGLMNITFKYAGGRWINGLLLEETSNSTLLNVSLRLMGTKIIVSGYSSTIHYGEITNLTIKLVNNETLDIIPINTTIYVYVNETLIDSADLVNGVGSWIFNTYESAGEYNVSIMYPGRDRYLNKYLLGPSSSSIIITVTEASPLIITSGPSTVYVGEEFNISVELMNPYNNSPIPGGVIDVYVNNSYVKTITTSEEGVAVFTYTSDKPGSLTISFNYRGQPGKYEATSVTYTLTVINRIETMIIVKGPKIGYLYSNITYTIELRDKLYNNIIPLNTSIDLYINGSHSVLNMVNGVYSFMITPNKLGLVNITVIYSGERLGSTYYTRSNTTFLTNITYRPITIKAVLKYKWINRTYLNISVNVGIYDKLTGERINRGYILIYVDKQGMGAYKLVANITLVSGEAKFNAVIDPGNPSVKIVYVDPQKVYVSGGINGSYIIYKLTPYIPPAPEPHIIVFIITALILAYIGLRYRMWKK